jgi:hypothetical protein
LDLQQDLLTAITVFETLDLIQSQLRVDTRQNQLATEPESLPPLTQLDLRQNLLTVRKTLENLAQLTRLRLGNQLTAVPSELVNIAQLTRFDLRHLNAVPLELGHLTQHTQLDVIQNQLTTVSSDLAQLTHLVDLAQNIGWENVGPNCMLCTNWLSGFQIVQFESYEDLAYLPMPSMPRFDERCTQMLRVVSTHFAKMRLTKSDVLVDVTPAAKKVLMAARGIGLA